MREVMKDTLGEAMDIDGLLDVLRGIAAGTIRCLAIDTPIPSLFAHELINAMPYAFLDDEDAAARRTRAVNTRRTLPDSVTEGAGKLDQAAIDTVRTQLWPDLRDQHELHDLLLQLVALPCAFIESATANNPRSTQHWPLFFERLVAQGRAHITDFAGAAAWVATECLPDAALLWPSSPSPEVTEPGRSRRSHHAPHPGLAPGPRTHHRITSCRR